MLFHIVHLIDRSYTVRAWKAALPPNIACLTDSGRERFFLEEIRPLQTSPPLLLAASHSAPVGPAPPELIRAPARRPEGPVARDDDRADVRRNMPIGPHDPRVERW